MTTEMRRTLLGLGCLLPVLSSISFAAAAASITDQNGRQVALPDRVNRVATLVIPSASMVMAVDFGTSRLVAINPSSKQEIENGLLGKMFPSAKSIRSDVAGDGFFPNVEALLSTRPDVAIQWGDRGASIVDPIVKAGVPVVTLRYGSSAFAADWLELSGKVLTGRESRGMELAARFRAARAKAAEATAAIPEKQRPKVVFLYRTQGNSYQVAGSNTSMDSDIELAGGINVAARLPGFVQVGVEQLLAWSPDLILLNNFEKDLRPDLLFGNALLAKLPAVKEKRVYVYPRGGFRWDPPSQESPLTWRWLQTLFHPDVKRDDALRAEIAGHYQLLYGYSPTDQDIDAVLRIDENGGSRHYLEKFAKRKN